MECRPRILLSFFCGRGKIIPQGRFVSSNRRNQMDVSVVFMKVILIFSQLRLSFLVTTLNVDFIRLTVHKVARGGGGKNFDQFQKVNLHPVELGTSDSH